MPDEADYGNCQLTGKNQIKRKQDLVGMIASGQRGATASIGEGE